MVRATQDFFREEVLQFYKPLILNKYFHQMNLFCHKDSNIKIKGFMGIVDNKFAMLFIGHGLKENLSLIDAKIEIYKSPDAVKIVNEQLKKAYDEKRKNNLQQAYKGSGEKIV